MGVGASGTKRELCTSGFSLDVLQHVLMLSLIFDELLQNFCEVVVVRCKDEKLVRLQVDWEGVLLRFFHVSRYFIRNEPIVL